MAHVTPRKPVASKVIGGTLGSAVGTVAVWLIEFGVTVPEPVSAAIVVISTFAVGWFVPETRYQTNG